MVELLSVTKKVAVTCTTGMACGLYENAITVHSFAGLKSSRMNANDVVKSIMGRDACLTLWKTADVVIIDEISK